MIKLFDRKQGVIVPSIDCYNMKDLKAIIENYPEEHMNILSYLFYMTCDSEDLNPYFNTKLEDREEVIKEQIDFKTSLEDPLVIKGLEICKKLYSTPTLRLYKGIQSMMDKLGDYLLETDIVHGRDGNITAIQNMLAKFDSIRGSFQGVMRDLKEEQKSSVRGQKKMAYDQR